MTIALVGAGPVVTSDGTNTMRPAPYSGAQSTDLHILIVCWLGTTAASGFEFIPDVEGWNPLGAAVGGANDNLYQFAYYRLGTPAAAHVKFANFNVSAGYAQQIHYSKTGEFWDIQYAVGGQSSSTTDYSATVAGVRSLIPAPGDLVLAITGLESDSGTITDDDFVQSGVTFDSVTVQVNEVVTSGLRVRVVDALVDSGTPAGALEYAHENASNNSGSTLFVRLVEYTPSVGDIIRRTNGVVVDGSTPNIVLPMYSTFEDENNLHVAYIGIKPFDANILPPVGWTLLADETSGTTVSGEDTGSVRVIAFYRFGSVGLSTFNFLVESGPTYEWSADVATNWVGVIETYTKSPTTPWALPTAAAGSDPSYGADYSATASATLPATAGDVVLTFTYVNSDAGTPSAQSVSLTGATLGAFTELSSVASSAGDDGAAQLLLSPVTAGVGSGAPQYSYTNASDSSGSTIFTRLHLNDPVSVVVSPPASGFAGTRGYYEIAISNIYPLYYTLSIIRVSDTGHYRPEFVHAAEPADTPMVFYDGTFHYASATSNDVESFHYVVDLYIGNHKVGSVTSNSVTPHADRIADPEFYLNYPWEQAPGTYIKLPKEEVCWPVVIGDFDSYSQDGRILGKYNVLGNPFPVVVTDVMSARRGNFTIVVYHDAQWTGGADTLSYIEELRQLIESGEPLYFQTVWPWMSGIPDFHFIVESVSVQRASRIVYLDDDATRAPAFIVSVEWTEVATSAEESTLAPITWGSLKQNYDLWGHMSAANVSWLDVLNDG